MAGRRELGFPKTIACSLREREAKMTLRNVRSQGHTYVDLREDGKGKRFIFFCTICLAPCYSEASLFDHLKGNLHYERYAGAKVTLLGENPFPFNDGILFCYDFPEQDKQLAMVGSNKDRSLKTDQNNSKLSVYGNNCKNSNTLDDDCDEFEGSGHDKNSGSGECVLSGNDKCLTAKRSNIVIPKVVYDDKITNLEVRFVGFGEIAARIYKNDKNPSQKISNIWCTWLGKESSVDGSVVPEYDFGIVTFSYNCSLGRAGSSDDSVSLLTNSPCSDTENVEGTKRKKMKKSFSDPEDMSESHSSRRDHLNFNTPELHPYGGQIQPEKLILSRTDRQPHRLEAERIRRAHRLEDERLCDICQQKILPGKDVSTLLNRRTGKLACGSRNATGSFHLFHTSCLIHWILLYEFAIRTNQLDSKKMTVDSNGPRKRGRAKKNLNLKVVIRTATINQISSVLCPECQGTGIHVEEKMEDPTVSLSEIFKCKLKISDAHRAWMKDPEKLENCSTGLNFSTQSEEANQGLVTPLKLLHFYRADDRRLG